MLKAKMASGGLKKKGALLKKPSEVTSLNLFQF